MSTPDFKLLLALMQSAAAPAQPKECPERTLVAPRNRSDHALLQLCRHFPILDQLRVAARTTRRVRFQGDMVTLVNMVRASMADVLFRFLQGQLAGQVVFQHRATAEMLDVVVDICNQAHALLEWQYTEDQCAWARVACCNPVHPAHYHPSRRSIPSRAELRRGPSARAAISHSTYLRQRASYLGCDRPAAPTADVPRPSLRVPVRSHRDTDIPAGGCVHKCAPGPHGPCGSSRSTQACNYRHTANLQTGTVERERPRWPSAGRRLDRHQKFQMGPLSWPALAVPTPAHQPPRPRRSPRLQQLQLHDRHGARMRVKAGASSVARSRW